jgi:hypothetical protein
MKFNLFSCHLPIGSNRLYIEHVRAYKCDESTFSSAVFTRLKTFLSAWDTEVCTWYRALSTNNCHKFHISFTAVLSDRAFTLLRSYLIHSRALALWPDSLPPNSIALWKALLQLNVDVFACRRMVLPAGVCFLGCRDLKILRIVARTCS